MTPTLVVSGTWLSVLAPEHRAALAAAVVSFLETKRFFRRGAPSGPAVVEDAFVAPDETCALLLVGAGDRTTYTLPIRFVANEPGGDVVANLTVREKGGALEGALVEAVDFPALARFLVGLAVHGATHAGSSGTLRGRMLDGAAGALEDEPSIRPLSVEQSHSMVRVGEHAVAKLLRALDPGDDTELELGSFLARAVPKAPVPRLLGWVRHDAGGAASTVLLLGEYVENEGTAFDRFRRELAPLLASGEGLTPELSAQTALLARRTAELHVALASGPGDTAFAPEPFDAAHGRALGASARALLSDVEEQLTERARENPDARRGRALLASARSRIAGWLADPSAVTGLVRVRCHGDYHLGQVLATNGDFAIVDLGGEPLRSVEARRTKHCPLRDVASMLRSFDYALETAARELRTGGAAPSAERLRGELEVTFLRAYFEATRGAPFVPAERSDVERLLVFYVLEKCLYEIAYELAQRPAWLSVPVAALERLSG